MHQILVPSDSWFWGCLHSKFSTLDNNSKYIDIGTKDSTCFVSTLTANNTRIVSMCFTAYAGNLISNFTFDIFTLFISIKNIFINNNKAAYNITLASVGVLHFIGACPSLLSFVSVDSDFVTSPARTPS